MVFSFSPLPSTFASAERTADGKPEVKINHGLLLGSEDFGIGKDVLLMPVREAVGPWNFHDISPTDILGTFNPFVKSVILRVNEVRDLGETNRFAFYDRMKIYTASPPEVLQVNEKLCDNTMPSTSAA